MPWGAKRVLRSSTFYPTLRRANMELATVEVRPQAQQGFVREVAARSAGAVWTAGGCRSWFLDHTGRNTTVWPWFTARFRQLTRRFDIENYALTHP